MKLPQFVCLDCYKSIMARCLSLRGKSRLPPLIKALNKRFAPLQQSLRIARQQTLSATLFCQVNARDKTPVN
jgi:hypothetical protein